MTTTLAMLIGGWLLVPLAWLLMNLLSTSLGVINWLMALLSSHVHAVLSQQNAYTVVLWHVSMVSTVAFWAYTLWLTLMFFRRRPRVRKHYVIWLLLCVLLAVKSFAFSPITDELAMRQLVFPLIATALLVPHFQRSQRVKATFVNA